MKLKILIASFLFSFIFCGSSFSAVILRETNILFLSDEQETIINLQNTEKNPTLVQSWVSQNDKRSKDFLLTPPLFRLEGGAVGNLRLVKMNQNLPQDRESLFYINVKEVPPSDPNMKNALSFAFVTSIPMRYRPESINTDAVESAYKKLTFSIKGDKLVVKNPTPYYVALAELALGSQQLSNTSHDGYYPPFSEVALAISKPISKYEVTWNIRNGDKQTKSVR